MPEKITREQFIEAYRQRGVDEGISLEEMEKYIAACEAKPCDCDYELCEGWVLEPLWVWPPYRRRSQG